MACPRRSSAAPIDEVKRTYADNLAPGKELGILLLPTEWERAATRIALSTSNGKVHALSFALPYKPHPEARDTLLELFKKKWGEPKELEDSKALLFHEEDPRIEIKDDTEHGAWVVEMR